MDRRAIIKLISEAAEHLATATPDQRRRLHEKFVKIKKTLAQENRQLNAPKLVQDSTADFLEEC